jgi:acyl-CoA synthetase (NDP forming)
VMKIISPEIIHKSDVGGVKLNLGSAAEVEQAFDEIIRSAKAHHPDARIHGVSVQQMARSGREIIIGMSKDPQFGPLLMFGIGGIMVEIMKDVAFRLVPLTPRDAREMIAEIKGYQLLTGFRGYEAADIPRLEKLLLEVSALVENHPQIKELDLNPVLAYKDGALIVDSRIILEEKF